jgi:hypothetical protein
MIIACVDGADMEAFAIAYVSEDSWEEDGWAFIEPVDFLEDEVEGGCGLDSRYLSHSEFQRLIGLLLRKGPVFIDQSGKQIEESEFLQQAVGPCEVILCQIEPEC